MAVDRKAQRTGRAGHKRVAAAIAFFRKVETFTHADVQLALNAKATTVGNLLREMWRPGPNRQIRICGWRNDAMGRPTIRVYEFVESPAEPDCRRLPPKTAKERQIAYETRKEHRAQALAQATMTSMVRLGR